ncbi:hypothetical protein GCM10009796_16580 [Microbacterium koreense]
MQGVRRDDETQLFAQLATECLGGALSRFGLAARLHERRRATFSDEQQSLDVVADDGGGDVDAAGIGRHRRTVAGGARISCAPRYAPTV